MTVTPVSSATSSADSAFGLSFQSLLQIILTQLTYQDPLKPLDNFQFVSQLAQFSQLQLSESLNTDVSNLLASQSSTQAVGMLGHTVNLTTGTSANSSQVTGKVSAVTFSNGQPQLTVTATGGQVYTGVSISQITQIL